MMHWFCLIFASLLAADAGGLPTARAESAGPITAECQATPGVADNFYEARGRFWTADRTTPLRGILVILLGTDEDARAEVDNPFWQTLARRERLGLLGCYLRGENEPYTDAERGSGQALVEFTRQLAAATALPALARLPLVLVGHSAGGMFACTFTDWMPQRVAAFIAVKPGPLRPGHNPAAALVPGLIIVGENDLGQRIYTAAQAFAWQAGYRGRWSFAMEPGKGHEWTPAAHALIAVYIVGVCNLARPPAAESPPGPAEGCMRDLSHPGQAGSAAAGAQRVWLPTVLTAQAWATFTRSVVLAALANPPAGFSWPEIAVTPAVLTVEAGETPPDERENLQRSFVVEMTGEPAMECQFSSSDPRLHVAATRVQAGRYRLDLRLLAAGLTPPYYRTEIEIRARGRAFHEASLPVNLRLASPYRLNPPSFYLGVLPRGEPCRRTVSITAAMDGETKWILTGVKSSNPKFARVLSSVIQPGGVVVTLGFNAADVEPGNQSGRFDLTLERSQAQERIFLPFVAVVAKGAAIGETRPPAPSP